MIHIQYQKSNYLINKNETIFSTGEYKFLLIEVILTIFSPNIYFDGIDIVATQSFNNYELSFPLNFLLFSFVLIRLYKPLKLILFLTRYFDFRAGRISSMMGLKLDFVFAIKCILCKHQIIFVGSLLLLSILSFSLLMNIYEGPVFQILLQENSSSTNNFENFNNCLWFIIVTTTTIGYGDYYPVTNIARIVTVLSSIVGNICLSILTYATLCYFTTSDSENVLIKFISRIECKENLDKMSVCYFKCSVKFLLARNTLIKFLKDRPIEASNENFNVKISMSELQSNKREFEKIRTVYYNNLYSKIKYKREFKQIYQYY